jgi:ABC-type Fe3+ transport system permease subunit
LGPLDALIHLANFVMPALGVAVIAAAAAKLLWRRQLQGRSWWRLTCWPALAGVVVLVLGLVHFGHDGEMATYAGLVLACAAALGWAGWGGARAGKRA